MRRRTNMLTIRDRFFMVTPYIPVFILAAIMIVPYYWMVLSAFKTLPELAKVPPTLLLEQPTLNNFYDPIGRQPPDHNEGLFQRYPNTPGGFGRYFANSVGIATTNTVLGLLIASLAAYVFAKHRFPGRNL